MLDIQNISKSFKRKKVLNCFSLKVEKGEIVSILGPSGVGKSTLLRCINGLEKIDEGEIKINNQPISSINKNNIDVGMVFQEYNLFPQYSAIQNIILPLTNVLKLSKEEAIERATELLKQMKLIEEKDLYPWQLSGGQKQRLAIARTLATNPKVICFDEPTSALDSKLVKQVYTIIKDLAKKEKAILIVTHDISFAEKVSDRIIQIENK